jgi:hypothetical protein
MLNVKVLRAVAPLLRSEILKNTEEAKRSSLFDDEGKKSFI